MRGFRLSQTGILVVGSLILTGFAVAKLPKLAPLNPNVSLIRCGAGLRPMLSRPVRPPDNSSSTTSTLFVDTGQRAAPTPTAVADPQALADVPSSPELNAEAQVFPFLAEFHGDVWGEVTDAGAGAVVVTQKSDLAGGAVALITADGLQPVTPPSVRGYLEGAISVNKGLVVFVASRTEIRSYRRSGETWTQGGVLFPPFAEGTFRVASGPDGRLLAMTGYGRVGWSSHYAAVSTDEGLTWNRVTLPADGTLLGMSDRFVIAVNEGGIGAPSAPGLPGIYTSADGQSWTRISTTDEVLESPHQLEKTSETEVRVTGWRESGAVDYDVVSHSVLRRWPTNGNLLPHTLVGLALPRGLSEASTAWLRQDGYGYIRTCDGEHLVTGDHGATWTRIGSPPKPTP